MKRSLLVLGLLLSVGINIGILATIAMNGTATGGTAATRGPTETGTPIQTDTSTQLDSSNDEPMLENERVEALITRVADELELTGEIREAFLDIQRRFMVDTLKGRAELARRQAAFRRSLLAPRPDRERIKGHLEEIGKANVELERAFAVNILAVRELLDDERERRYIGILQVLQRRVLRGEAERIQRRHWLERRQRMQGDRRPGEPGRARPEQPQ
ncbi:MAG: hypothetical protein AAGD38_16220 [Acidobacteriota bacterium]